ncbi:hypothetical protein PM082_008994 [Marasmius tenuissimus]|nr:hypothetical protein PM082_008994 [Marasmius tenuissimus]
MQATSKNMKVAFHIGVVFHRFGGLMTFNNATPQSMLAVALLSPAPYFFFV